MNCIPLLKLILKNEKNEKISYAYLQFMVIGLEQQQVYAINSNYFHLFERIGFNFLVKLLTTSMIAHHL